MNWRALRLLIFKESRRLILLRGYYQAGMDVYVFSCEGKKITLQYMTDEQIARLFRTAQLKDTASSPRSSREKTYAEMVAGIKDGSDTECWIWSNMIDLFFSTADGLRRSRIGKAAPVEAGSLGK
jgi:hypothetical protein